MIKLSNEIKTILWICFDKQKIKEKGWKFGGDGQHNPVFFDKNDHSQKFPNKNVFTKWSNCDKI